MIAPAAINALQGNEVSPPLPVVSALPMGDRRLPDAPPAGHRVPASKRDDSSVGQVWKKTVDRRNSAALARQGHPSQRRWPMVSQRGGGCLSVPALRYPPTRQGTVSGTSDTRGARPPAFEHFSLFQFRFAFRNSIPVRGDL
jgi:hypothetical protein